MLPVLIAKYICYLRVSETTLKNKQKRLFSFFPSNLKICVHVIVTQSKKS